MKFYLVAGPTVGALVARIEVEGKSAVTGAKVAVVSSGISAVDVAPAVYLPLASAEAAAALQTGVVDAVATLDYALAVSLQSVSGGQWVYDSSAGTIANFAPISSGGTQTPTAGDDIFQTTAGDDTIDGGAGLDTAVYSEDRDDFQTSKSDQGVVTVTGPTTGTDTLTNVERLQFGDGMLAFDTGLSEHAGLTYRVYQAAFARTPDTGGLKFWLEQIDKGVSLLDVSKGFVYSAEFLSLYGANQSNTDFVARLYQNVLGRDGEASGIAFWVGELDSGVRSKAQVLADFSESPENVAGVAPAINDGIWLA